MCARLQGAGLGGIVCKFNSMQANLSKGLTSAMLPGHITKNILPNVPGYLLDQVSMKMKSVEHPGKGVPRTVW